MEPRRQVAERQTECVECGLGATTIALALTHSADPRSSIDPETMKLFAQHRARSHAAFVNPPFPLFGLDDRWLGPRYFGGAGNSGGETTSVTLAHGHMLDQAGPEINVETKREARFPVDVVLAMDAGSLVLQLAHQSGEMRSDVRAATFAHTAEAMALWDQVELPVNERPVPFRVLHGGEHWIALTALGQSLLAITARSWPVALTGLVTVQDLRPYRKGDAES